MDRLCRRVKTAASVSMQATEIQMGSDSVQLGQEQMHISVRGAKTYENLYKRETSPETQHTLFI